MVVNLTSLSLKTAVVAPAVVLYHQLTVGLLLFDQICIAILSQGRCNEETVIGSEFEVLVNGTLECIHHDCDVTGMIKHHGFRIEENHRNDEDKGREAGAHVADIVAALSIRQIELG